MLWSCAAGPLRAKKAPMTSAEPTLKQTANFWGARAMRGRKTVKERDMKKMLAPSRLTKKATARCEGIDVADLWMLPGKSWTFLEKLQRRQKRRQKRRQMCRWVCAGLW